MARTSTNGKYSGNTYSAKSDKERRKRVRTGIRRQTAWKPGSACAAKSGPGKIATDYSCRPNKRNPYKTKVRSDAAYRNEVVMGRTHRGKKLYRGKLSGVYYISAKGSKVYVQH